ncbi:YgiT-type zinc finger protein [Paenibacillus contaminans]|uniref:YgiT-type zinc finger protein n=1 Tax=Paenibacillus contaminans TaxID=450362 RepID=A0A329MJA7_9BACL|nr:YgiT-type zinc finger protein [Paenibacillus contaminans]RAV19905.1 hypothetical protein DQG23_18440 [Paenibacillus contaminans]
MSRACKCSERMSIRLRTVIYQNKVEIENVPIYYCEACGRSEVFPEVKPELTGLIGKLGAKPDKQQLPFQELSELALLMKKATDEKNKRIPVEKILEERINELLDLLLLAQSLKDEAWAEDARRRLKQISEYALSTYDFT